MSIVFYNHININYYYTYGGMSAIMEFKDLNSNRRLEEKEREKQKSITFTTYS